MPNGYSKLRDDTMDTTGLRENFTNQLLKVKEQIAQLESDLDKAKEYKLKLEGGLETLDLLSPPEAEEAPQETAE